MLAAAIIQKNCVNWNPKTSQYGSMLLSILELSVVD